MACQKMIAALVVLALAAGAAAHGGELHEWPSTPTGSNYIRQKIASCSNWVPADGKVAFSLVNSSAAAASSAPIFKGDVTVWYYLYGNCSVPAGSPPSAGVEFNVTATRDGKPAANLTLNGVAMTGSCRSGGGQPYYLNLTAEPLNDKHNILWFHNFTTNATGRIHGNGANDGFVYTSGNHSVQSVMLVNYNTNDTLACCDLEVNGGDPDTDWLAKLQSTSANKTVECDDEGHATADSSHDDHSDHGDHSDHDHSEMTANKTGSANSTTRATSGSGVTTVAGLFVAIVAVAASMLVVV